MEKLPGLDLSKFKKLDSAKNSKILEENHELENYMFFANLENMQRMIRELLKMDKSKVDSILCNGHNWAADHIATSKDDIEEVYNFLMTHDKKPIDFDPMDQNQYNESNREKTDNFISENVVHDFLNYDDSILHEMMENHFDTFENCILDLSLTEGLPAVRPYILGIDGKTIHLNPEHAKSNTKILKTFRGMSYKKLALLGAAGASIIGLIYKLGQSIKKKREQIAKENDLASKLSLEKELKALKLKDKEYTDRLKKSYEKINKA